MNLTKKIAFALTLGLAASQASAEFVPNNGILAGTWDSWNLIATDDGETEPGSGGQDFDAEYMFYKLDGLELQIGLQTGYDVVDNQVYYGGKMYYGGDIAVSFDGDSDYEYAIDFGLITKDYYNDLVDTGSGNGIDSAGVYEVATDGGGNVTGWNDDVYTGHGGSAPFAVDAGSIVAGALLDNTAGSGVVGGYTSYFRKVTIDLALLGFAAGDDVAAALHWTMSCGNDVIEANIFNVIPGQDVPAGDNLAIVLMGLLGIALASRRRSQAANEA